MSDSWCVQQLYSFVHPPLQIFKFPDAQRHPIMSDSQKLFHFCAHILNTHKNILNTTKKHTQHQKIFPTHIFLRNFPEMIVWSQSVTCLRTAVKAVAFMATLSKLPLYIYRKCFTLWTSNMQVYILNNHFTS